MCVGRTRTARPLPGKQNATGPKLENRVFNRVCPVELASARFADETELNATYGSVTHEYPRNSKMDEVGLTLMLNLAFDYVNEMNRPIAQGKNYKKPSLKFQRAKRCEIRRDYTHSGVLQVFNFEQLAN